MLYHLNKKYILNLVDAQAAAPGCRSRLGLVMRVVSLVLFASALAIEDFEQDALGAPFESFVRGRLPLWQ